jgi:hypothetical protein
LNNVEALGPFGWVDAGSFELLGRDLGGQRPAKHLAPLAKRRANEIH